MRLKPDEKVQACTSESSEKVFPLVEAPDLVSRRHFIAGAAGAGLLAGVGGRKVFGQQVSAPVNLARVAVPSSLVMKIGRAHV